MDPDIDLFLEHCGEAHKAIATAAFEAGAGRVDSARLWLEQAREALDEIANDLD